MRDLRLLSIIDYDVFSGPHNHDLRLKASLAANGIHTIVLLPDESGNALPRLRAAGMDVITYRSYRPYSRTRESKTHIRYLLSFASNIAVVRKVIKEHNIDLVQLADPFHPHGAVAARLERVPLVVHLVGTGGSLLARTMGSQITCRLADVIMTNGIRTRAAYPGVCRPGRCMIDYFSPIDLSTFRPDIARRNAARAKLQLSEDDVAIGNIGRLHPEKDHVTCVRAAALIRRSFPKVRFIMMGAVHRGCSGYLSSLWQTASASGLRPGRDIIHIDAGRDVADLAQAFDICWSTGLQEGATTAVGEAMALGIPVVCADVSAVGELIEQGISGFAIPPGAWEALAQTTATLLENTVVRRRVARAARERAVQLFGTDVCAAKHLSAYDIALSIKHSTRSALTNELRTNSLFRARRSQ